MFVSRLIVISLFSCFLLHANQANVLDVKVECNKKRICTFWVTVEHADTGWEHYANSFEILKENGTLIKRRILAHPHVEEQPFTRSLDGVKLHKNLKHVIVRARDSVHKYGGKEMKVAIP